MLDRAKAGRPPGRHPIDGNARAAFAVSFVRRSRGTFTRGARAWRGRWSRRRGGAQHRELHPGRARPPSSTPPSSTARNERSQSFLDARQDPWSAPFARWSATRRDAAGRGAARARSDRAALRERLLRDAGSRAPLRGSSLRARTAPPRTSDRSAPSTRYRGDERAPLMHLPSS